MLIFAVGIAQNPMFGDGTPPDWAALLPAYGPVRMMVDGAFSPSFDAAGALVIAIGWTAALMIAVSWVLRRAVGTRA